MSQAQNATFWDFNCPLGGSWYACDKSTGSRFVGCCTSNPCTSTGCSLGNTRAGAYNGSMYATFPEAGCGSASQFWTCGDKEDAPTFWGCCKTNPCANGAKCPDGDLVPAFTETEEQIVAYINKGVTDGEKSGSKSNTGAIAGGVVGGVAVLAIIGVIVFLYLRRRRRHQQPAVDENAAVSTPMMGGERGEKPDERLSAQYGGQSPPPMYSTPAMGHQDYYQNMSPKDQYHNQYAQHAVAPQELPAEMESHVPNRFSELPAEASSSAANNRYSELPAGSSSVAAHTSELESPQTSPRPLQSEFQNDMAKQHEPNANPGLGVVMEDATRKN